VTVGPTYDVIGRGYSRVRRPDPRLAQAIWSALGDARTVLNVGAGAGSYEPPDRWVLAVEPSEVMIDQRLPGTAPVLKATVEQLPLADQTVDAAMAILTLHHWENIEAGLLELVRVVRDRVVILTMDTEKLGSCATTCPSCSASTRRASPPSTACASCCQARTSKSSRSRATARTGSWPPFGRNRTHTLIRLYAPRPPHGTTSRRRLSSAPSASYAKTSTQANGNAETTTCSRDKSLTSDCV